MIRTIKLRLKCPARGFGGGELAWPGDGGWLGKGVGFPRRASVAVPPAVGESLGLPAAGLSVQVALGTEG